MLDSRMKELQATGMHRIRKTQSLSPDHENILWEKGLLGDHCTLVFYIGLFSLCVVGKNIAD